MSCPDPNALQAYLDGTAAAADAAAIRAHLSECAECREVVLALANDDAVDASAPTQPGYAAAGLDAVVGELVGRYVILNRLGAGGMGVVYAAYDPELDRRIALKLIRRFTGVAEAAGELQNRLLREAQAMARIAHPNVAAVYDVGRRGEQVFIAMELVHGDTLAAWLLAKERSPSEIVAVFARAAEGLAAAHAAGLIHRDFKPNNVMINDDGRVRVMDFGLARPAGARDAATLSPTPSSPLDVSLTASGVVVGTPAYMAPEQLLGEPADASSDQFSFCVAQYEALCGTRPFKGDSTDALRAAIVKHELQRPKRSVPPWLMRIVERGLAAAPAERWPSMQSLIAALRHDPAQTRRRWLAVGGVACLLIASGVVQRIASRHEATRCQNEEQRLVGIWDAPRREAVRSALSASQLPFAIALADDVTRRLDRYAQGWVEARVRVCEATRKRGEQSEALLDVRMQCLDERIDEVRALGDVIVGGRGAALEHAGDAARALSSFEDCPRMTSSGATSLPVDPAARAVLASLRRRADDAAAADRMVDLDGALRLETALTSDPQVANFPALQAEVLLLRGRTLQMLDRIDEAQRSMTDAIAAAVRGRDDHRLALISLAYALLAGTRQSRLDEALAWERVGEALSARLGKPDALEERRLYTLAAIYDTNGQLAPAEEAARADLALAKKMFPPGDVALAQRLNGLANVLGDEGHDAESAALYEESLALLDKNGLGQTNDAADQLYNLSLTYTAMARYADVERVTRRALHIKETILGRNDFSLMGSLHNLGGAIVNQGRPDEAEPILRRALALAEQRPDEDPAAPADIVAMLGTVEEQRGRLDAAIKLYEQALAKQPVEVARGEARFDLARALWKAGRDRTRAVALARKARTELGTRPVALRKLDQWLSEHRL